MSRSRNLVRVSCCHTDIVECAFLCVFFAFRIEICTMETALIEAVEKRRCLFDKTDPNYCNRTYVSSEWNKVAKEVGCNGENLSHVILFIFCLCLPVCVSVSLSAFLSIGIIDIFIILYPNEKRGNANPF